MVVDKAALMHSGPPPEAGAEDEVRAPKELFILLLLFVLMNSGKRGDGGMSVRGTGMRIGGSIE